MGDKLARSQTASAAARAGALAVQAYLRPTSEADQAAAFRAKAISLAEFLEKTFPNDPPTDAVRLLHGDLHSGGQYLADPVLTVAHHHDQPTR